MSVSHYEAHAESCALCDQFLADLRRLGHDVEEPTRATHWCMFKILGKPFAALRHNKTIPRVQVFLTRGATPPERVDQLPPELTLKPRGAGAKEWGDYPHSCFIDTQRAMSALVRFLAMGFRDGPDASSHRRSRVQGHEPDAAIRREIERWSMVRAEEHYQELGFAVENTSTAEPYDLRCTRGALEVHVEVKGTRGEGEVVEVTIGEVRNASGTAWRTDLFVLSRVDVHATDGGPVATGSRLRPPARRRPLPRRAGVRAASAPRPRR